LTLNISLGKVNYRESRISFVLQAGQHEKRCLYRYERKTFKKSNGGQFTLNSQRISSHFSADFGTNPALIASEKGQQKSGSISPQSRRILEQIRPPCLKRRATEVAVIVKASNVKASCQVFLLQTKNLGRIRYRNFVSLYI